LFKQLKQNFPIKFFLGGHENAIKIQIWCAQAVNLLLTVIRKKAKCKWGGNLAGFYGLHLFKHFNESNSFKILRKTGSENKT
jgi:IS4 transposase